MIAIKTHLMSFQKLTKAKQFTFDTETLQFNTHYAVVGYWVPWKEGEAYFYSYDRYPAGLAQLKPILRIHR